MKIETETALPIRKLGRTGLEVTQLGFGTAMGDVSDGGPDDDQVEKILNAVLDAGINFIDTAPDYGESEERIGKYISHRRDQFYLATKCGCNIDLGGKRLEPGHLWTQDRLHRNIDQSLIRMKTDYVDIVQMHNPTVDEVEQGELVPALEQIRQAGKTRFIGVSSTTPDLLPFAEMDVFDVFQVPYSAVERTHEQVIQRVSDMGAGLIIRGGIGQGHHGGQKRWDAWERAKLDELAGAMSRYEFVLRFTLSHLACHTTIVGTTEPNHLRANVSAAQAGPLPGAVYDEAKERLATAGEEPQKIDS